MVETDQPFCFQRHIAILKPAKETDPKFLHMLMGSPAVFREGWARTTGSAQPTLPLGNLRSIPISIPPLAEQQEIVRRVAGLFALADQLERRLAQARKQVDKLTPSLLARAFAGKLVPQDSNDESAKKLLERIKTSNRHH
jgi:type I restriction enzyme S subunit